LGRAKSVPNSEVSSFQGAICTENSSLGPDGVLISQDVLISQGCYSQVSLYMHLIFFLLAGRIVTLVKCLTTGRKVLGSILASTSKGAQLEPLTFSPCEIIKIC
jgi:hypothetical protein